MNVQTLSPYPQTQNAPRVALVHYWLVRMRGGESVLAALMEEHPDADVFTNVYHAPGVASLFEGRRAPITTYTNKLPFAPKLYPLYMPLMPAALERLDLNDYDLVVSSEAGPAKWVLTSPNARHVCYVHSPMRYLWDQRFLYRKQLPWPLTLAFDHVTSSLRHQDVLSASRVDHFVANSRFVAARIARYYKREAIVIPPPVQLDDFGPPLNPDDYYLLAGQLVSYKQSAIAVQACIRSKRRLVVVGDGPEAASIARLNSKYIDFRGRISRQELVALMSRARALLYPGVEDFGIVPVEMLAAGRPIIALGKGGILDTVQPNRTGILYDNDSIEGLISALDRFEEWEPQFCAAEATQSASGFSPEAFKLRWRAFIRGLN